MMRNLHLLPVLCAALALGALPSRAAENTAALPGSPLRLPLDTVFKGEGKFYRLVKLAEQGNWRALPIGERTARVGRALVGTPYVNYTLEIDDRVEAPSVNFNGMDCWTFYEISLGFARMLRAKDGGYQPRDLLSMIELERYRNGKCTGNYLSRMHFLEEVFADNSRRGLSENPTRTMGGIRLSRNITEMTSGWRSYRYLRNNTYLLPAMAGIQRKVSALPVYHIPRSKLSAAEKSIRTGDVIAITSKDTSGYTSHVGLAVRQNDGVHLMHATSNRSRGREVILDERIAEYLQRSSDHAGIVVYRPKDL